MGRRSILVLAGAMVLALALVAPALARRAADPYANPVPYGWMLQLRSAAHDQDFTMKGFRNFAQPKKAGVTVVDPGKDPVSTADDTTGTGIPLYRLVGRIDDNNPNTFNAKLATTAPGYTVQVTGVDGFTASYTSAQVAALGDKLVVCDRISGRKLGLGSASIKDGAASWKPLWPLKVLSSDPSITGKGKIGAVERISIVPVGVTQIAPF
jgi:hypothetical protein